MIHFNKLSRNRMDELDRLFQEELAALERAKQREASSADAPLTVREEFDRLRRAHGWTVADVLGFFPHEEAVGYLAELITQAPSASSASPA